MTVRLRMVSSMFRNPLVRDGAMTAGPKFNADSISGLTYMHLLKSRSSFGCYTLAMMQNTSSSVICYQCLQGYVLCTATLEDASA